MTAVLAALDGERMRAEQHLRNLRSLLDSVEATIADGNLPPGLDVAQAAAATAVNLVTSVAKIDALMRVAR